MNPNVHAAWSGTERPLRRVRDGQARDLRLVGLEPERHRGGLGAGLVVGGGLVEVVGGGRAEVEAVEHC